MSLKLTIGDDKTPEVIFSRFPAGETHVRINDEGFIGETIAVIEMNFEGNNDLFDLALLVDAARRLYIGDLTIYLHMDYVPYARQDRVCNIGESLSIKVVADFINGLNLDGVFVSDLHSSVAGALFNKLGERTLTMLAPRLAARFQADNTVLVSPDAGANKKVLDLAKWLKFPHVVRADKTRDVLTGAITGTAVYSEHVGTKDFLIVDDICDGGRTFIELAKELKKLTTGRVFLYVTHGIFSKGTEVFDGLIDGIYMVNPVGASGLKAAQQPNVTVI